MLATLQPIGDARKHTAYAATVAVSDDGETSDTIPMAGFRRGLVRLVNGTAGDIAFLASDSDAGAAASLDAGAVQIEDAEPDGGWYPLPDEVFSAAYLRIIHPDATSAVVQLCP